MRLLMQIGFVLFISQLKAQEAPKSWTAPQMHRFIAERLEAVRTTRGLDERKKLAEQLLKECNEMEFDAENMESMEANNACYNGISCFDSAFSDFKLDRCRQYIKSCHTHFAGGNAQVVVTKDSGESYGFQMLSAMGCKVPPKYLTAREPSSTSKEKK